MIPRQPAEFLYYEAELLDSGRLDEWLALYADDAVYWLPQREHDDPSRDVSIVYADRRALRGRVVRLNSGFAHSQLPPSRTVHFIGNIRLDEQDDTEVVVHSSLLVVEARRERQQVYAGTMAHTLARSEAGLRIRKKVVRLVNGDAPLGNLTFLF